MYDKETGDLVWGPGKPLTFEQIEERTRQVTASIREWAERPLAEAHPKPRTPHKKTQYYDGRFFMVVDVITTMEERYGVRGVEEVARLAYEEMMGKAAMSQPHIQEFVQCTIQDHLNGGPVPAVVLWAFTRASRRQVTAAE